ncbi:hypothetical protein KATP_04320 [Kluyvera ascorbata]|nr:hypothetical protein KATP_04320 [Kluyvera ascorbata]
MFEARCNKDETFLYRALFQRQQIHDGFFTIGIAADAKHGFGWISDDFFIIQSNNRTLYGL